MAVVNIRGVADAKADRFRRLCRRHEKTGAQALEAFVTFWLDELDALWTKQKAAADKAARKVAP